ncbi:uncharacterized protein LOC124144515 [Haliotis rufescens]|uniref:uncharacterized protein LOC124144515 n=1 Tax=Haliotis rufescens TaxID=6454 RepID=UPI00201E7A27|nr:uncharacterized protein LOC124144515 [Haliotis rufescens]
MKAGSIAAVILSLFVAGTAAEICYGATEHIYCSFGCCSDTLYVYCCLSNGGGAGIIVVILIFFVCAVAFCIRRRMTNVRFTGTVISQPGVSVVQCTTASGQSNLGYGEQPPPYSLAPKI